jgi:acyl-CoA reductase-like NAD-dependent aldehyde dehydrogenase
MTQVLKNFIAGEHRAAGGDRMIEDLNPSNRNDVIAHVPAGVSGDVDAAVAAASSALGGWRRMTGPSRSEHLYRWAGVIDGRREEHAHSLAR